MVFLVSAGAGISAPNDDFLPENFAPSRYSSTWSASPFDREIIPPPPAETGPGPFDGLSVSGYYKVGEKFRVTLIDKKNQKTFVTSDPADSDDGLHVVKVTRADRPSGTKVTLRRGTQEAEIGFDSKRVAAAPKGLPIQQQQKAQAAARAVQAPNPGARSTTVLPKNPKAPNPAAAAAINPANRNAAVSATANPQAAAAQQNAQAANQQLIEHLRAAAARSNTNTGGTDAARPQRRRVVLPPTVGNP